MPRQTRFRAHAVNFSLTYAQAAAIENKDVLANHLRGLPNVAKVLVAMERHEDGGIHYHACVGFSRKYDCRDERFFDVLGVHPNIQTTRNLKDWLAYCTKDGDFVNHGFSLETRPLVEHIHEIIEAGTPNPVAAVVAATGDRGLRQIIQIDRYVSLIQKPDVIHQPLMEYPADFVTEARWSDAVISFYSLLLNPPHGRTENTKSLWLYGPSRMGKTTLARSLGTHWYMQGMWNAEMLTADAEYGVMDDIPWEYMKINYKGMLGFQKDVTVTDKYKKKVVYAGGIGVIVCSNELPEMTAEELMWMDANVVFVYIGGPVFPPARVADGAS